MFTCHWHHSSVFILDFEQFSHLNLVLRNETKQALSKQNLFFPINSAITKICVVIVLAEDGTRMEGI